MLRTSIFDGSELKPYLYDRSLDYERDYLRSSGSLVVLAFNGDRVVGATTCLSMLD